MAGLATNIPGLIWASENKILIFSTAGILLTGNGFLLWRNRLAACPLDERLRNACLKGRRSSKTIYFLSLGLFSIAMT
ncbi:MAG: hypothetical protein ACK5V3_18290, partial [Bdellovibrionales bacterium]